MRRTTFLRQLLLLPAILGLLLTALVGLGSTTATAATTAVGTTASDCAGAAGFARPAGAVPPGYIYNPSTFDGTVRDPHPDDTFVGTTFHPMTGRFQVRSTAAGQQFLVCAHVGTNSPDDALTPFATSSHAATIAPQVVVLDAVGRATTYTLTSPGVTDVAIAHYAGSTDVHQGIVQMWVPVTAASADPGFTVRVEIRGTSALAGGTTRVMGADEVFVHVGNLPVSRNATVDQSVGLALDDGAIAERPSDPGADDLFSVLKPLVPGMVDQAVAAQPAEHIDDSFAWSGWSGFTKASADLNGLRFSGVLGSLDLPAISANESRLQLHITGSLTSTLKVMPRSIGLVSIVSGSCDVTAHTTVALDLGVTIGLDPTQTRPVIHVAVISATASSTFIDPPGGSLWALYGPFPSQMACTSLTGKLEDGISKKMPDKLNALKDDPTLGQKIDDKLNASTGLDLVDLAHGPLSSASITLPGGSGFGTTGGRYVPTAPNPHVGGDVLLWGGGLDVVASLGVTDKGGSRFPYSYRPTATTTVVNATHARTRFGITDPVFTDQTRTTGTTTTGTTGTTATTGTTTATSKATTATKAQATATTVPAATTPAAAPAPGTVVLPGPIFPRAQDFDLGLIVNGASVNQISRALTAGAGVGSGLLDITANFGGTTVTIRPQVAPLYLPTPPAGWGASGPVNLLIPSIRSSSNDPTFATNVADLQIGATAQIDTTTNHLVPSPQSVIVAHPRFLRLAAGINQAAEPPFTTMQGTLDAIAQLVPERATQLLGGVQIPDLSTFLANSGGAGMVISHLSMGTFGGNLGIYLDVDPNPTHVGITASWTVATTGANAGKPSKVVITAAPTGFPGTAGYTVRWTIRDSKSNAVIYTSPAAGETSLSKTILATALGQHGDTCSGERNYGIKISVAISRNGVTGTGTAPSESPEWEVPINPHVCPTNPL